MTLASNFVARSQKQHFHDEKIGPQNKIDIQFFDAMRQHRITTKSFL